MTDLQWHELMEKSPAEGYRALIDEYGNLVYAIVLNKLKGVATRHDIEDCVSDVFVELFQNFEKYSPSVGTLKGFLSTIAKRTAIDAYRRLARHQNRTSSIEEDEIELVSSCENPEKVTEKKLYNRHVWDVIKNLGEPDSTIIIRQYFYEQTASEIGRALSMTANAVHKRSQRAREKLREILTNELKLEREG